MHLPSVAISYPKKYLPSALRRVFLENSASQQGFALITTISLLVLLGIIALGLLTLSSTSLRASGREQAMATAQANARLALMLALGQLQMELGPDQRINAPAEQQTNPPPNPERKHWVGVHNSWNSFESEERPSPSGMRWLVSGTPAADAYANAPSPDDVIMFSLPPSPDGSPGEKVSAPLVMTTSADSATGGYAWWISDDNSKALVTQAPEAATTATVWSRGQAPATTGFTLHPEFAAFAPAPRDEKLARIISHKTFDLATGKKGTSQRTFHDFTNSSLGVIADVQRGGLKRDLSLFLDEPVAAGSITPAMRPPGALYPNGITFEELWLYHNVWRALEPPPNRPNFFSPTGGDLSNTHMLITAPGVGADSLAAFRNDPFTIYKHLTTIRMQWLISMKSELAPPTDPPGPDQYRLYWVSDGIMTLWNPYDVPIAVHPDAYYSTRFWGLPFTFQAHLGSKRIVYAMFGEVNNVSGIGVAPLSFALGTAPTTYFPSRGTPDPVVLMPGEVLLMSEGTDPGFVYGSGVNTIRARAGWNLGQGKITPALNPWGDPKHERINATDRPRITVAPNRFNVYGQDPQSGGSGLIVSFVNYYGADQRGSNPGGNLQQFLGGKSVHLSPPTRASDLSNQFDGAFTGFQTTLPMAQLMTGNGKYPFMLFSFQAKTEDSQTSWSRFYNPKWAIASHNAIGQTGHRERAMHSHELKMIPLTGPHDSNMPQLSLNNVNRGLFGGSYTNHQRGQEIVITHSIPREPPLSLGAFQHAIANGVYSRLGANGALHPGGSISPPEVSKAIGNSYALPVFNPDRASGASGLDHSWHVNRTLWDSWFLSGIVQQQAPHHKSKRTAHQVFTDFAHSTGSTPLPNANMKPWIGDPEEAILKIFDGSGNKTSNAHEMASSLLLINGAFNVQSTSVAAWKALLTSMNKAVVPVAESPDKPGSIYLQNSSGVPASSLLSSHSPEFDLSVTNSSSDPRQWRGSRSLNPDEIDELAKAVVKQVKLRGPFLSLADFINRRLDTDETKSLSGALQAALDETVNARLLAEASRKGNPPAGVQFEFPEAAKTAKTVMGPAMVMQADILTAIGPQLTARSDTFRIRSYGEARDSTGTRVVARAWCEATVQRIPDYIDPIDPPEATPKQLDDRLVPVLRSQENQKFGRKFVVTSFRWLDPVEINS